MAPLCVAGRLLPVPVLFVFVLFVSLLVQDVTAILVYDRQMLINIKITVDILAGKERGGSCSYFHPDLSAVPLALYRLSAPCAFPLKKRRRRRGKRGGLSVKLKAKLLMESRSNFDRHGYGAWDDHRFIHWRSLEPAYVSLRQIVPTIITKQQLIHTMPYLRKGRGVNLRNFRSLCYASQSVAGDSLLIKMALVNARSLCNKTFILRDFLTSKLLYVLLVTETWLSSGDLSPFADLVPSDCKFINSPRSTGKGGGLATVFKNSYHCRLVETELFPSFELQTHWMSKCFVG